MVAPSVAAVGAFTAGAASASCSIAAPSGMANNEIALAFIYMEANETITSLASGFAETSDSPIINSGGFIVRTVWKRASGADAGPYAFTLSGAAYREAVCMRITGCITTGTPYEGNTNPGSISTSSTASPAVSLTTLGADRLLVHAAFDISGTGAITPSSGFTNNAVLTTGGIYAGSKSQAVAGATGSVSCTFANSGLVQAWLAAFIPAGGAPANTTNFFQLF